MNGDRLDKLTQGFLDGKLSMEEERELKEWVLSRPVHPLKSYFDWVEAESSIPVPETIGPSFKKHKPGALRGTLLKVAAAVLILLAAWTVFQPRTDSGQEYSQAEIDRSYEATIETLSAMAAFLDKGMKATQECMDMSQPFKDLNELKNDNSK